MAIFRNPWVEALLATVVFGLVWEAVVRLFHVPIFILPPPSAVIAAAVPHAIVLAGHAWTTLWGTIVSLVVGAGLGLAAGLGIGYSRKLSRMLYPLLGGMHALPMSAFIPIFVVWFGVGNGPKLLAGVLIAFFPVVVNVVNGLRTIEPELWEMLKTLGATKAQMFHKIGIPRSMPYFLASLKVAAAGAFIGNVVGEMVAAGHGLGYVLIVATSSLNMPLAFAALSILLIFGILLFTLFESAEKRLAPWAYRSEK